MVRTWLYIVLCFLMIHGMPVQGQSLSKPKSINTQNLPSVFGHRANTKQVSKADNLSQLLPFQNNLPLKLTETRKIFTLDPTRGDLFGTSVSISDEYAIIGARGNPGPDNSGAAFIYKKTNTEWVQIQKLTPSGFGVYLFGSSVSISGNHAIVGAPGLQADGHVFIYEKREEGWVEVADLTSPVEPGFQIQNTFGSTVSISGDKAIVGAILEQLNPNSASVFIYEKTNNGWIFTDKLRSPEFPVQNSLGKVNFRRQNDLFGSSVSISGNRAIVGAPSYSSENIRDIGAVFVFEKLDGSWKLASTLTASDGSQSTQLGGQVFISGDQIIANGGPSAAYVFEHTPTGWSETAKLTAFDADRGGGEGFGAYLSIFDNFAVVSAPGDDESRSFQFETNSGAAYVFQKTNDGWIDFAKLVPSNSPFITDGDENLGKRLGDSCFIFGEEIFLGVNRDDEVGLRAGGVYVFSLNENDLTPKPPEPLTNTVTVKKDGTGNFATIKAALKSDIVQNGSEVVVYPGGYPPKSVIQRGEELLLIDKAITLRSFAGPNETFLDGQPALDDSLAGNITVTIKSHGVKIIGFHFLNNDRGIYIDGRRTNAGLDTFISNNVFHGIQKQAILIDPLAFQISNQTENFHIANNIFFRNGTEDNEFASAIHFMFNNFNVTQLVINKSVANVIIANNILFDNFNPIMFRYSNDNRLTLPNSFIISHNNFLHNKTQPIVVKETSEGRLFIINVQGVVTDQEGNYTIDPNEPMAPNFHLPIEFKGQIQGAGIEDYRIVDGSPMRDQGLPGLEFLDPDGSRNDIGAFGGPGSKGFFDPSQKRPDSTPIPPTPTNTSTPTPTPTPTPTIDNALFTPTPTFAPLPTNFQTKIVSVNSDGAEADDHSENAMLSADGRFVVFESYASNLVPNDTNEVKDIFVHDIQTGETTLISKGLDGNPANDESRKPAISANGRYVVFESIANNIVEGDPGEPDDDDPSDDIDLFIYDRQTGETKRITKNQPTPGVSGGGGVRVLNSPASLSSDGRFVTFVPVADNVEGFERSRNKVFLYDRIMEETTLITESGAHVSLSSNGRFLAFQSSDDILVKNDTNRDTDVFVYDREKNKWFGRANMAEIHPFPTMAALSLIHLLKILTTLKYSFMTAKTIQQQ